MPLVYPQGTSFCLPGPPGGVAWWYNGGGEMVSWPRAVYTTISLFTVFKAKSQLPRKNTLIQFILGKIKQCWMASLSYTDWSPVFIPGLTDLCCFFPVCTSRGRKKTWPTTFTLLFVSSDLGETYVKDYPWYREQWANQTSVEVWADSSWILNFFTVYV